MQLFNTNKERRAFWEKITREHSPEKIEEALDILAPDTARVLRLHYQQLYTLTQIVPLINRSISVVRNHHNRGIFRLGQYFGE
jgi:DNA-directed RNA polymerase specialized sigma24 family protein